MDQDRTRPFYHEYAWAYDLLIDRPVRKECVAIADWLIERGVRPGAALLDAGCGTGRYAIELARRGYVVHGIDRSPELLDIARQSACEPRGAVTFQVGDIRDEGSGLYHGILCRRVLNDVTDDGDRAAVFEAFARALRPAGVLIVDVREWEQSEKRKAREPLFRKRVSTSRGELTFTSITELDRHTRTLLVSEQHALVSDGRERTSDYRFVMRCWTRAEVDAALAAVGFSAAACFGAYDPTVAAGATDRVVVVAVRA